MRRQALTPKVDSGSASGATIDALTLPGLDSNQQPSG